jgi:hypothetical protein
VVLSGRALRVSFLIGGFQFERYRSWRIELGKKVPLLIPIAKNLAKLRKEKVLASVEK